VEYPGYGPCKGEASEATLFERADLALKEIQSLSQKPIILLGESLGSGPASYLASKNPSNTKLALVSPFTSAVELASERFPYLPVKWMMKDRYENQRHLRSSKIPLHVVHATLDTTIPLDMGKKLFEGYQGPTKAMTIIPGYDHSNIPAALVDSPLAEDFRNFILN
jgi:pimeloyl-ACP methyl ester carboxylesterase